MGRISAAISRRSSSTFFHVDNSSHLGAGSWVTGTVLDHSVDVNKLRVGDVIEPPYEITLETSFRDMWLGAFHSNDRINVSTPFARKIGFQDAVLPFPMMLFLASAMTHADAATVQLGFSDATYQWPAFAKDTITRSFVLKRKRETADGLNSIFTFGCTLRNQRGKVVFTADRTMMFLNTSKQTMEPRIEAAEAGHGVHLQTGGTSSTSSNSSGVKPPPTSSAIDPEFQTRRRQAPRPAAGATGSGEGARGGGGGSPNEEKGRPTSSSSSSPSPSGSPSLSMASVGVVEVSSGPRKSSGGGGGEGGGGEGGVGGERGGSGSVRLEEIWDPAAHSFKGKLGRFIVESQSVGRLSEVSESQSLAALRPGQLLLHDTCRPMSATQSMQLSSLARLTHPRHFNHHVYNFDEIFIPGGLVVGLTASASNRDLHEVLHEELMECHFVNNVHPGDTVGALTFVKELEENVGGDLEALTVRTIGVKNIDVGKELVGVRFPFELFENTPGSGTGDGGRGGGGGGTGGEFPKRRALEALCEAKCPELSNNVVCVLERRVLRQAPRTQAFLL